MSTAARSINNSTASSIGKCAAGCRLPIINLILEITYRYLVLASLCACMHGGDHCSQIWHGVSA